LIGIIVGHTYFFLMFKYPQEMGGPQLIQTPQILLVFNRYTFQGIIGSIFILMPYLYIYIYVYLGTNSSLTKGWFMVLVNHQLELHQVQFPINQHNPEARE